ncbi:MAG: MATE family efflux transporter [Clostridia bacterium]|nr:MATE family efflux transporter [Clostridia bacterium]
MSVGRRRGDVEICTGPLLLNIFRFAVPIMLSGLLQTLFNSVDAAVVGRFGSATALASVGSTASLTHLLVNMFLGLSVGAGVAVAQGIGAEDRERVRRTIGTCVSLSLLSGVLVAAIGVVFAPTFLRLMGSPAEILGGASTYMRIYFAGMPAIMLFNFGSSVLRSMGDTRRPLYFLFFAGILNMALNLLFVVPLHMDVAGVALSTVISQCIAAFLVAMCLVRLPHDVRLERGRMRMDAQCLWKILRIGLPAGLQSCLFSFSNVIIQSSVNSLGATAVSANAAATNLDNFVYIAMNGVTQSATTFVGQNYGARDMQRVRRAAADVTVATLVVGCAAGVLEALFGRTLLRLFTTDAAVIAVGMQRLEITATTYYLCGLSEALSGSLRGTGRSLLPMCVTLLGVGGLRILWVYTVFPLAPSLGTLYWAYPLSWIATTLVLLGICLAVFAKEKRSCPS